MKKNILGLLAQLIAALGVATGVIGIFVVPNYSLQDSLIVFAAFYSLLAGITIIVYLWIDDDDDGTDGNNSEISSNGHFNLEEKTRKERIISKAHFREQ